MVDLNADACDDAVVLLEAYYDVDRQHMPYDAPKFHPTAALWAAKYLFNTIQLILIRDAGVDQIDLHLKDYERNPGPEEIYSADLMLRFLPDIFRFASGLSPNDPLVDQLRKTAENWPFSSVGIEKITTTANAKLLGHPSLRLAYIDRIIQKKDIIRTTGKEETILLKEVLGIHQAKLWPNLNLILNEETTT